MVEERSAGAVVFHRGSQELLVLLLHYPAGHWDFPKGNIERGESELDTVRREVAEETGISGLSIIDGFRRVIEYHYRRGSSPISKRVFYYLAGSSTKNVKISSEHSGFAWLSYDEAVAKVSFKNSKMVLREAHEFLTQTGPKSASKDP